MAQCPYCQTSVIEDDYFCENCEQQVKCRSCDALLRPNKTKCLKCGTPLVDVAQPQQPQVLMNEYLLEEKHTTKSSSRRISVRAATEAISHLAPVFGLQNQPPLIISPTRPLQSMPSASGLLPPPILNQVVDEVDDGSTTPQDVTTATGTKHKASELFEADGDGGLTAIEKDFKGKSKKDQQKRFALLYVWAYHHLIGQPMPSKEHMLSAARKAHLFDSAFPRYFDEVVRESFYPSGTGLKVKPQEEIGLVQEILAEIDNRSITGAPYSTLR